MTEINVPSDTPNVEPPVMSGTNITGMLSARLGVEPVTLTRPIFAAVPLDESRKCVEWRGVASLNAVAVRLAWTVFAPHTVVS